MPDATERSAASGAPPSHVTPMTSGIAQTANATRLVSSDAARVSRAVAGAAVTSDRDAPETAVAVLVVEDGLVELAPAEVGPEHRRHEELGVRELPEEEIGDPLLAGGPDQEVGVGAVAREELAAEGALVDLVAGEPAGGDILREEPGRAHELGARTIGDEEIQPELRAERRLPDHALHRRGGGGREALQLAEHAHLHSLPLELVRLPLDVLLQERHQRRNLARGPLPVLLREGEEREHLEPHSTAPPPGPPPTPPRPAFTPLRCPKERGSRRSRAQRPLPSMMMATWRGGAPWARIWLRRSLETAVALTRP